MGDEIFKYGSNGIDMESVAIGEPGESTTFWFSDSYAIVWPYNDDGFVVEEFEMFDNSYADGLTSANDGFVVEEFKMKGRPLTRTLYTAIATTPAELSDEQRAYLQDVTGGITPGWKLGPYKAPYSKLGILSEREDYIIFPTAPEGTDHTFQQHVDVTPSE